MADSKTYEVWLPVCGEGLVTDQFRADVPKEVCPRATMPSEIDPELSDRWGPDGDGKTRTEDSAPHSGDPAVTYARCFIDPKDLPAIEAHLVAKDHVPKSIDQVSDWDRNLTALVHLPRDGQFMDDQAAKAAFENVRADTPETRLETSRLLLHAVRMGMRLKIADQIALEKGLQ